MRWTGVGISCAFIDAATGRNRQGLRLWRSRSRLVLWKRAKQHSKSRQHFGGPFPRLIEAELLATLPVDKFAELLDVGLRHSERETTGMADLASGGNQFAGLL